jgi:hypothetical protein
MSTYDTAKYSTLRFGLEPSDDAAMRQYCDNNGMTYTMFFRLALKHLIATVKKDKKKEIPGQRDVYGRIGKSSITLRISIDERRDLVRFARMMNFKEQRSFNRLARYAVKTYLAACADAERQAQSPEPASADSPLP